MSTIELLEAQVMENQGFSDLAYQPRTEQIVEELATPADVYSDFAERLTERFKSSVRQMTEQMSASITQSVIDQVGRPLQDELRSTSEIWLEAMESRYGQLGEEIAESTAQQMRAALQPDSFRQLAEASSTLPRQTPNPTPEPNGTTHTPEEELIQVLYRLLGDVHDRFEDDIEVDREPLRTRSQLWFCSGILLMYSSVSVPDLFVSRTMFYVGSTLLSTSFAIEFMGADPIGKAIEYSEEYDRYAD